MILVQKQPQLPIAPIHQMQHFNHSHKRHPSAPPTSLVVQPTRTPGLLSLSKPQQQQRQPRSPRPRLTQQTSAQTRSPQRGHETPAKPISETKAPAAVDKVSTEKNDKPSPRGRQQAKPTKDKASFRRSASETHHKTLPPRRATARQPSPPISQPSQAEAPTTPTSTQSSFTKSSLFDPFLVDDDSVPPSPPSTRAHKAQARAAADSAHNTPAFIGRPSGKLAKRRQPYVSATPAPVPVPATPKHSRSRTTETQLSVSEPPRKLSGVFPVCDDNDDSSDDDMDPLGPRTAPLHGGHSGFPFGSPPPSPTPTSRGSAHNLSRNIKRHRRTPSEGTNIFGTAQPSIFGMDSDLSTSSVSSAMLSDDLRALFKNVVASGSGTPQKQHPYGMGKDAAGYFASSNFQNSPSPDELPPPSF